MTSILADLGMRQLKNLARPEHVFELRLETADDSQRPHRLTRPWSGPVCPRCCPVLGRSSGVAPSSSDFCPPGRPRSTAARTQC